MNAERLGSAGAARTATHSPERIYGYVTDGVRDVIGALETQAEDAEDEAVRSEIVASLHLMQASIANRQEELRASADWKVFTVALYGETNAGKSTIIECLRIHLGEPTKVAQRRQFDELAVAQGLSEQALQSVRVAIESAREAAEQASLRGKQLELDAAKQLQQLERERALRVEQALAERIRRSWWRRLIALFKRNELDRISRDIDARITHLQARQQRDLQQIAAEKADADATFTNAEESLVLRLSAVPELLEYADGGIIGDGRPDFTRATQRYTFHVGGAPCVLLDVPGIEGDEEGVNAHIENAVQTAHAVFYVTGKAARPQHGDKEDGTLEKIKRHLGPQTEVWAVFNKRVTAPMPLRHSGNLFAHDTEGMADLDQGLGQALGPNYRGVMPVSAYPAFLALADHLPAAAALNDAQQSRIVARTKFLSEFDATYLLEKTQFKALADHIAAMAVDAPRKIRFANIYKAHQSLQAFVRGLEHHAKSMESQAHKVSMQTAVTQGQVDIAAEKLEASLRTDASDAVRTFQTGVRKQIYALVDRGISNDDLKSELHSSLEAHVSDLQSEVGQKFKVSVTQFQSDIANAAERFRKHLKELDQFAGSQVRALPGATFSLNLRIDSGISVVGLVTTAIGAIASLFTGPPGWIAISLSAAGVALSLAKALWGLVDNDFKKSQQRNAVDENLTKAVSSLKKDLAASEKAVVKDVERACTEAKKHIGAPQRNVKTQASVLRVSANRLSALSKSIEITMEQLG